MRDVTEFPPAEDSRQVNTDRAHPVRIYDYWLGGKNNFAADRAVADKILEGWPSARTAMRENRAFMGRAVRYLAAEAGITQFLDIGTGLPSVNAVHEVAQSVTPSSRVVYVDNDPQVLAHARALLTSSPEGRTAYVDADLRAPASILEHPTVRDVLDFGRPVALMLVFILHLILDSDRPREIIAALMDALPSGSYIVASHGSGEHMPAVAEENLRLARQAGMPEQTARDSDDFARIAFPGLELVPPGVVLVSEWRSESAGPRPRPAEVNVYGGMARKP